MGFAVDSLAFGGLEVGYWWQALLQHFSNLGRKCLGLGLGDITAEMENQMKKNMEHGMPMEMGSVGMVGMIPPVSRES